MILLVILLGWALLVVGSVVLMMLIAAHGIEEDTWEPPHPPDQNGA